MIPQRVLATAGVLLAVLLIALYAYSSNTQFVLYLLVAFPIFVYFVNNVRATFVLSIALTASALTLPGLPFKLTLDMVFMLMVTATLIATAVISKSTIFTRPQAPWITAFLLVVLFTAWMRGFGLRMLGGEAWGGFTYVTVILYCVYFLAAGNVRLTETQWRTALVGLCLLSLVPTIAEGLYALTGGATRFIFHFVVPEFQVLEFMYQREQGSDLARLHQANIASQYLFMLALLVNYRRRKHLLTAVLVVASFVLAGIAGNRISLVFNGLLLFIFLAVERRTPLSHILFRPITLIGLLALLVLCFTAEHLPMTFQRVLSAIPFANVSWEARSSAQGTISWRFEVWKAALEQVPRYLLVGKGFAFSAQDVMIISMATLNINDIDRVIAARNYHNGLIQSLLDLGLPGLILTLGFIVMVVRRHGSLMRVATWYSPMLQHFHRVMFAVFITWSVVYYALSGSITHFCTLMVWGLVLEGLARTNLAMAPETPAPPKRTMALRPRLQRVP